MTVALHLPAGGFGGPYVIAWQTPDGVFFQRFDPSFHPIGSATLVENGAADWISIAPTANGGFSVIWDTSAGAASTAQDYDSNGAAVGSAYAWAGAPPAADIAFTSRDLPSGGQSGPWTTLLPNGDTVIVTDNPNTSNGGGSPYLTIQQYDPAGNPIGPAYVHSVAGLPGLGHVETAPLANGGYAVSFVETQNYSAQSYVDLFNAKGTHLASDQVAQAGFELIPSQVIAGVADGGYAVSWVAPEYTTSPNDPPSPYAVFSQEFGANGSAATQAQMLGVLSSNYTPPQIDALSGGYTVSWTSSGTQHQIEYGSAISQSTNETILTPALNDTLPNGPRDAILIGDTVQIVTGNNLGDTIASNDSASTLIGGGGNDTLIAGHDANLLTGGGGADTFVFNALPWNAGQIADFTPGIDKLDLSGIFNAIGYHGSDPVGDGYLTFQADGQGDTQVYVNSHAPSDPYPTLITTLDGISPSSIAPADYGYSPSGGGGSGGSSGGATLTTLATFDGSNGASPESNLSFDSAGDLLGTTRYGGNGSAPFSGTAFEIAKTGDGYASAATTLADFPSGNATGFVVFGPLFVDAAGNLLGTTAAGGSGGVYDQPMGEGDGTVFEIAKSGSGYAAPANVALFDGTNGYVPNSGVMADSAGNLLGTSSFGGASDNGAVFEIAKTANGYASTATAIVGFDGTDQGREPTGVVADTAGNLFGVTTAGGTNGDGTIFEIATTVGGYASTPMTLANFSNATGVMPQATLIMDSNGDLFGTAGQGANNSDGAVFELMKTADGYVNTPTVLAYFDGSDGAAPLGSLTMDAAGDLFGTTQGGGANGDGTVFEIAKAANGYATTPTTIFSFDGSDGAQPLGGLIADSAGNLFGTTQGGGSSGQGTAFELAHTGFVISSSSSGETLTADDTAGQHLTGTPYNDTFNAEQNSVVMTGDGGADKFVFNALPWNAGQITDFNTATGKLDLSGIFNAIGYHGSDPVGDGYLTFQADGQGDTQVYINSHAPSDPYPTLITTLDHVAPSSITPADYGYGSGSGGGGSTVDTSASNYTVPAGVTNVVLTGNAPQTVTANNAGDTITSNDYGSTIQGGTGNDTLIAGHGADMLAGNGGNDSFVYNDLPWNAGQVADFNPSNDVLNLKGIFGSIGYTGSNPTADGYLNFVSDGAGDTKVYVNPHGPGTAIPILVTTLEHVDPSAMHHGDYLFA